MTARETRIYLGLAAFLIIVVAAFAAFAVRPTPLLGVDGASLGRSLGSARGSTSDSRCVPGVGGSWRCTLTDPSGGSDDYSVESPDSWGCWDVRESAGPDGEVLSGCITLLDHR